MADGKTRATSRPWRLTGRARDAAILVCALAIATATCAALGLESVALVGIVGTTVACLLFLLALHTRQQARIEEVRSALTKRLRSIEAAQRPDKAMTARVAALEQSLQIQRAENARLEDMERASYRLSLRQHVRLFRAERALRSPHPSAARQLPFKLRNIELAASHGVGVPEIFAVWPDLGSIDLTGLPDCFVLKADGGAGSTAVFPLERVAKDSYRHVGAEDQIDEAQLVARLRTLGSAARPPYFAEELLRDPTGRPIPDDIKLYMFYGEVGQILVRNVGRHGDNSSIRLKFVDEDGRDFGDVAVGRRHDPSIEVPDSLGELVSSAKHLSKAVGLPFCRVDLYETSRGVVLGEITMAPSGGNERFVDAHDELLGALWLSAAARLTSDLHAGRPVGPLFGTEADLRLYPANGPSHGPARFDREVVPCERWCAN